MECRAENSAFLFPGLCKSLIKYVWCLEQSRKWDSTISTCSSGADRPLLELLVFSPQQSDVLPTSVKLSRGETCFLLSSSCFSHCPPPSCLWTLQIFIISFDWKPSSSCFKKTTSGALKPLRAPLMLCCDVCVIRGWRSVVRVVLSGMTDKRKAERDRRLGGATIDNRCVRAWIFTRSVFMWSGHRMRLMRLENSKWEWDERWGGAGCAAVYPEQTWSGAQSNLAQQEWRTECLSEPADTLGNPISLLCERLCVCVFSDGQKWRVICVQP